MSFLTSRAAVAPRGFGKPVPRREDARLVTGQGRYSDDFNLPGQVYAQLVRSPHAHALDSMRLISDELLPALHQVKTAS